MATLKFVVGGAGSGKTTELCREVIQKANQEPDRSFLYLVPEQFTMQTQKALVDLQEEKAIMNIDVLSFQRLAYRVFDDLGVVNVPVLGENGKNLILRRVAQEQELSVLKSGLSSMGFVTELKSFVSELMQYQITPEALLTLAKETGGSFFSEKCKDLAALYEGFLKQIRGSFITTEEVLSLLIRYAEESKLIRESVLFLDGYTGFTPIQVKLLYTLFPLVSEVVVAVCADSLEEIKKGPELTDLFYMSQKMTGQLMRIALDTGSEVLPPVVLEKPEKRRFIRSGGMAHLERNLFRDESRSFAGETDAISLTLAFHPRAEMEACAEAIRRLVEEEGYRYKEIAVVTGDLPVYAAYAGEVFGKYQIPFFVDQNKTVTYHPLTEAVRGALYAVSENNSYESVFHYFRSGLTDYTPEEIDELETWCLANGIRGSKWEKEFTGDAENLPLLNEMRQFLLDSVEPLRIVFQKKNRKIETVAKAVYAFLLRHSAWEKMQALARKQEELQEEAKAAETSKIYKIVIEFLEKAAEILQGQDVTVEEFLELFDAALESEQVGVLPAGYDRVVIGDIERSRFQEIRALFFLGVNDGVVPKTGDAGALISEQEREIFSGHDLELAPGEKERVFIQRFYLYLNLTKPSERLFVSYAASDREGKALRPSYLIMVLKKLFPTLAATKYLPKPIRTGRKETDLSERKVSPDLAGRLYGTEITAGVTRLENFASCAYRHFLRYALLLTERDLHEFRVPDLGNLIHDSLAVYGNELKDRKLSWKELAGTERDSIIKYAFDKAKEPFVKAGFFEEAVGEYELSHLEKLFARTVETLSLQLQAGSFTPRMFELPFRHRIALSEEHALSLVGRIDRIDLAEAQDQVFAKILDYKTGEAALSPEMVYYGLSLQLPLYATETLQILKHAYKNKVPRLGGLLYYHVDDPVVDFRSGASTEDTERKRLRELRPQGLMNSDPEVLAAADHLFDEESAGVDSDVLRIRTKRDGSFYADAKVLPEEQLLVLSDYAAGRIKTLGEEILAGKAEVNPVRIKDTDACRFCGYKSICGVEKRGGADPHKDLPEMSPEEALRRMKTALEET